jgi:hypothetical protein
MFKLQVPKFGFGSISEHYLILLPVSMDGTESIVHSIRISLGAAYFHLAYAPGTPIFFAVSLENSKF